MSDEHRFERDARAWLELGPTDAPDRVVEAALLEIDRTSQERDFRVPWRLPAMNSRLGLIAAALVAAVAASLVFLNLPGDGDVGAPSPSPTPAGSNGSTPSPAATRWDSAAAYTDLSGWIVFEHFGQAPDGSTSEFDPDHRMIWLVHADGSDLHELAPSDPIDGKSSPDISPDGTTVVFASWTPRTLIWEADIAGGPARLISTDCDGQLQPCMESDPAYSPDGSKIAFTRSENRGATAEIAIRDLATGEIRLLRTTSVPGDTGYVAQPSWSPDGTRLVYYRVDQTAGEERPTQTRAFVVRIEDGSLTELPRPEDSWAADPDWSPVDDRIVFSTAPNRELEGWDLGGPRPGIWTINADGTGLFEVCGSCFDGGLAPSWTPDGGKILFWGFRSFALVNPDGTSIGHINQPALTWFGEELGYGYAGFLAPEP